MATHEHKDSLCEIRVVLNEAPLPECRGLQVAHNDEHGEQAEGRSEHDRHEEEPLDQVGVADHAARVVAHVQQLEVDVDADRDEGSAPPDAQVGLKIHTRCYFFEWGTVAE